MQISQTSVETLEPSHEASFHPMRPVSSCYPRFLMSTQGNTEVIGHDDTTPTKRCKCIIIILYILTIILYTTILYHTILYDTICLLLSKFKYREKVVAKEKYSLT